MFETFTPFFGEMEPAPVIAPVFNGEHGRAIYRHETRVTERITPKYNETTDYVRVLEIHRLKEDEYQILTHDFSFSNEDCAEGQLQKRISQLFDEIEVTTDRENNIIKILNRSELKLRWAKISAKLSENNGGEAIESYFGQMAATLGDEESILRLFKNYKMFGLYFNGLYGEYPANGQKKERTTELYGKEVTEVLTFKKVDQTAVLDIRGEGSGYQSAANYHYRESELIEAYAKEVREETLQLEHSLIRIG